MKDLRAFLAAIADDWIGRMSGGGGLLLATLAFFLPSALQPMMFLGLGVLCLFYACYRAWLVERKQAEGLRAQLTPRLEFTRDADTKPFREETSTDGGGMVRYLRIGIRNLGAGEISQARLVLEGCEPGTSSGVHPEHELQPMGRPPGTLTFSLSPYGMVLVDVAREVVADGEVYGTLYLCYAQPVSDELPNRGDDVYTLTLRAEGAGRTVRCSVDLGGRLTWRLDGLKLLP